jgi:hypothetical protein
MDCALSESGDRTESREGADAVIEAVRSQRRDGTGSTAHTKRGGQAMPVKTHIEAEKRTANGNEPLVGVQKPTPGLKVKTGIKAGAVWPGNNGGGGPG